MSRKDIRGVPVSSDSQQSLDRLEQAFSLFQGYFNDPMAKIDAALAEDPDFIMGHCFRAGLFLISSEKAAVPELRRSLQAAEALADRANERERGHMGAIRAWLEGDFHGAAERYGRVLIDYPRDAIALQFAHQCDFLLGQSQMLRDRVARLLPYWNESVPGYGYVLGMHAFGLEEMGHYHRAEETGRRALSMEARDPWAIHAVAHVMEMQGRLNDGVRWLNSRVDDWSRNNGFAFHNWWHLALFYLDLGDVTKVLEIYDRAIRPQSSDVAMEMVDAASLLWRLQLRGHDVGKRWKELADIYEGQAEDAYYAFNDLHAMFAFVSDGRDAAAQRLLKALQARASGAGSNAAMTREVGLPACRATEAFGWGDYATAIDLILPLRHNAHRFGGSHAQRDVLSLTLIEAAFRARDGKLARALAAERSDLKPTSPFNWTATARAFDLLAANQQTQPTRSAA